MPQVHPRKVKTFGELQAGITPMIPGQPERIPWTWFDTQTYVSGTTVSLDFFQQIQAIKANGNMEAQGQIPAPQYFDVYHIGVKILNDRNVSEVVTAAAVAGTINDTSRLLQGRLTFSIAQKVYYDGPVYMCPAGGGVVAEVAVAGTFTADDGERYEAANNGNQDLRNRNNFWGDITIPHNQNFLVRLEWAAALTLLANTQIKIALDGYLYRRVL